MAAVLRGWFKNQTCFGKVLTTIGIVAIGFQVITLVTLARFMVVPLGQRAAEDLSGIIVHAAEKWHALPVAQRPAFARMMQQQHKLQIAPCCPSLPESDSLLPYLYFLRSALRDALGHEVRLLESRDAREEQWFWVDVPVDEETVRIGFSRPRIGVRPPVAFLLLLSIGLVLTLVTATFLTRRITVPIERLYQAAKDVGQGHWPAPIEEDGPKELSVLTREFNRMNVQVRELLSNRTTLLAGIAHDLRTPLTQIQLALELLPDEGGDPQLMQSIREDLDLINRLIGEALGIGLASQETSIRDTDVCQEIVQLVQSLQGSEGKVRVNCKPLPPLALNALALRRILTNLIVNALRYGDGKAVEVDCRWSQTSLHIRVMDRGPGIPESRLEAVFQPFHRLETSRSSQTGGSGLGLAIVRQLAEANRWQVGLEHRPGGGLIATLTIPLPTAD